MGENLPSPEKLEKLDHEEAPATMEIPSAQKPDAPQQTDEEKPAEIPSIPAKPHEAPAVDETPLAKPEITNSGDAPQHGEKPAEIQSIPTKPHEAPVTKPEDAAQPSLPRKSADSCSTLALGSSDSLGSDSSQDDPSILRARLEALMQQYREATGSDFVQAGLKNSRT